MCSKISKTILIVTLLLEVVVNAAIMGNAPPTPISGNQLVGSLAPPGNPAKGSGGNVGVYDRSFDARKEINALANPAHGSVGTGRVHHRSFVVRKKPKAPGNPAEGSGGDGGIHN